MSENVQLPLLEVDDHQNCPRHSLVAMAAELRERALDLRRYAAWIAGAVDDAVASEAQHELRRGADELLEAAQLLAHCGQAQPAAGEDGISGRLVSVSVAPGRQGFSVALADGGTRWFATRDTGVLADARDMLGRPVIVAQQPLRICRWEGEV